MTNAIIGSSGEKRAKIRKEEVSYSIGDNLVAN